MVPFPIDFRQDTSVICQILDSIRPKGSFFGELLDVQAIQHRVQYLRWKTVAGRDVEGCAHIDSLCESPPSADVAADELPESVILHSAGVCALPHTVRHGRASLSTQMRAVVTQFGLRESDVICFSGTLASPAACSLVFAALTQRACISLDDPTKLLSPIALNDSERLVVLFAETSDHSLSAERLLLLKGAKSFILSDASANDERVSLIQRATDAHIFSAYCCAEACGFLCVNSSPGLWPADAAGVPVPNVEIAVLDAKSRPVHNSLLGRVAFRISDSDDETWCNTGDWGRWDENGLLHIAGCERAVIWKAGFPVFAREVENALRAVQGVNDAWVFGIPDRDVGEEVTAQVTISDTSLTIETLLAQASEKLPTYMIPHEPLFVQELRVTPSGKKVRRTSRIALTSAASRPATSQAERGPNLAPATHSADLGSTAQN
jgi:hypothetical protein